MKKLPVRSWIITLLAVAATTHAADFKQSKVTEVVNQVDIISAADQAQKAATVNDLFKIPDILRTGPASRAELVAPDETVTRVGANTIFSFDPASRTIDLKQGSLLFHSPHGKGGGSIHTGSATASVLGSTLIVCATPNGGFKVICLEDDAQIKLVNGLKQQLSPGQMTYILPGGKQLAPVIMFRLDDLVGQSLLVKGFVHPLPSMPLLLNEVDKQTKLIKSGKATDTGLLAGNNASVNQVEVLDPNTIQPVVIPHTDSDPVLTAAEIALKADATLGQSSLTDPAIPTPPTRIFLDQSFTLANNSYFAGRSFKGFAGRDVVFSISDPNSPGLTIDLGPYASTLEFDLVAAGTMNIANSVTFSGLSSQNSLFLIGGNQITLAPNIMMRADAADFELITPGPLTMNGGQILNSIGNIGLTSGSLISIINGDVNAFDRMTLTAKKTINVIWDAGVGISGNNVLNTIDNDGQVNLVSHNGALEVSGTSIRTHVLTLNSGDRILLDSNGRILTGVGTSASANFSAPNLIEVKNADFSTFGVLNAVANTITIVNANLPLITNAGTQTGQVNVNGPVTTGWFNIINSRWMGTPITSANQVTLSSGPGSSPGIYSYIHP
ncbi:MAG: FecR family protein [Limisphaerales bacterium]